MPIATNVQIRLIINDDGDTFGGVFTFNFIASPRRPGGPRGVPNKSPGSAIYSGIDFYVNRTSEEAGWLISFIPVYCAETGIPECRFATVLPLLNMGFWSVGEGISADIFIKSANQMEMK